MSEEESIRVNFGNSMPLFPIDGLTLLPQQVIPLHIFESRYREMIRRSLDSSGQIAMACFDSRSDSGVADLLPLRPVVCVGHIINHEKLQGGRYNILLQGVCRAKIVDEIPTDESRPYRSAVLEPMTIEDADLEALESLRDNVGNMLDVGSLSSLAVAPRVLEFVQNEEIPADVLLELLSFTLIDDAETKYRFLAEGRSSERAALLERELKNLGKLLDAASRQNPDEWPKGLSWN